MNVEQIATALRLLPIITPQTSDGDEENEKSQEDEDNQDFDTELLPPKLTYCSIKPFIHCKKEGFMMLQYIINSFFRF